MFPHEIETVPHSLSATLDQSTECVHIAFFIHLDLYYGSPESSDLCCKSGVSENGICSHCEDWGVATVQPTEWERDRERERERETERQRQRGGGGGGGLGPLFCTGDTAATNLQGGNYFKEMCSGPEAGSYLRLIDFCITQL